MQLVYMSTDAIQAQKEVSDLLDLKIQVAVSQQIWIPGSELRTSGRAVYALNH